MVLILSMWAFKLDSPNSFYVSIYTGFHDLLHVAFILGFLITLYVSIYTEFPDNLVCQHLYWVPYSFSFSIYTGFPDVLHVTIYTGFPWFLVCQHVYWVPYSCSLSIYTGFPCSLSVRIYTGFPLFLLCEHFTRFLSFNVCEHLYWFPLIPWISSMLALILGSADSLYISIYTGLSKFPVCKHLYLVSHTHCRLIFIHGCDISHTGSYYIIVIAVSICVIALTDFLNGRYMLDRLVAVLVVYGMCLIWRFGWQMNMWYPVRDG